jgi:hypothetical protein
MTSELFTPDAHDAPVAGDAPEAAPPAAQPEAPAASSAGPLSWRPFGQELNHALKCETAIDGGCALRLSLLGDRPVLADVREARTETAGRLRSRALDLVTATPEYARLVELRPQFRAAAEALSAAEKKAEAARKRRADLGRLTPAPANLPARLVQAQSAESQSEADRRAKQEELAAIEPLYRQAQGAVRAKVSEVMPRAYNEAAVELKQEAQELLAGLAERNRAELTRLLLNRRCAEGLRADMPRADQLAALLTDSPDDAGE